MKRKLFVVASYDISDPKRLRKIAKIMEDYGKRVLYSVFECRIERELFYEMKMKVKEVMDPIEDSVIYFTLCKSCSSYIEHIGRDKFFIEDERVEIV